MVLLASIPLGIIIGWLCGGKLRNLEHLPIRGFPFLVIPILIEYGGGILNRSGMLSSLGITILVLCAYALLINGIRLNWHIVGLRALFAGFVLNFLAVTLNGFRMPFSPSAAKAAGFDLGTLPSSFQPITSATHLSFLADIIPIHAWKFHPPEVISVGDIVIMVGLFWVIQAGMRIQASHVASTIKSAE